MASIRERTGKRDETTWAVLYRQGKRQTSHTFRDRKKAEDFRSLVDIIGPERALAAIQEGARDLGLLTVDELAERFLDKKAGDVTARTIEDYRRDYANWIKPWFGHRAAEHVNEADVQKWVDHMGTRLSPKSVAGRHMLLHSMYAFGRARVRRLVTHNPCEETELPRGGKRRPKGTTLAEWRAILHVAETRNPDAHDLILFLGAIGWRWSEAAALAVADVEDDGMHVWVDVTRVFRMIDHRQVVVPDAAKTFAGFRRTRVNSECAAMFRRRVVGKAPSDFVFTNSRRRSWNQNTFLRETWPALREAAGVGSPDRKPTPHWLRHMAVSSMARAEVPMHEIQRIIGHGEITTTNTTYGGMVSTLSAASVARLDAVLEDRAGRQTIQGEVVPLGRDGSTQ